MPGSRCCLAVCPFTTVPRRQLELVLVDISSLRHVVRSPFAVTSREWALGRRWVLEPCSGAGLGGSWVAHSAGPFRGNEPLLPACQTFRGSRSLRHSGQRTRAVRPSWRALRVASAVREL